MFQIDQFRLAILQPSLDALALYSQDAEELLVAVCAQESLGGTYLTQVNGPARGIYQMEKRTHDSLWQTILVREQSVRFKIMKALMTAVNPNADRMVWDLQYATMMARVFFLNISEPIPSGNDIEALWIYYKTFWNTNLGAAKKSDFIINYNKFCGIKKNDQSQ
jgi:hypothetical protein